MTKQEHENYLKELEKDYGKMLLCTPKREGAFYFGELVTYDEYVIKYREAVKGLQNGHIII